MSAPTYELPPPQQRDYARARKLEWLSLAWIFAIGAAIFLSAGRSQTMKTAWLEKALGLVPPAAFLVASRIAPRRPDARFPFGYQRAVSIAFLLAAFALFLLGCFLLGDGAWQLLRGERPEIGRVEVLGRSVWLGWLMIATMLASASVSFLLGRAKLPLSRRLHDKGLHTDAVMNKADWETDVAAVVGIAAVGAGLWWADAVAAMLISVDILLEGRKNLWRAVEDLADHAPRTLDRARPDPLCDEMRAFVRGLPWVEDARVHLREQGRYLTGEAWVIPRAGVDGLASRADEARRALRELHWRIHDVALVPTAVLPDEEPESKGSPRQPPNGRRRRPR